MISYMPPRSRGDMGRPRCTGRFAKDPVFNESKKGVSMRKAMLMTFAVSMLYAAAAGAANVAFLNRTILAEIPRGQSKDFAAAVGDALTNVADGQSSTWTGKPERKNQPPISATFHPRDTVKLDKGMTCRLLDTEMRKGERTEAWKFMFCQQADGTWRASDQ